MKVSILTYKPTLKLIIDLINYFYLFEFFLSIPSHSVYALSFFWYGILGFLITFIIGYLASFIFSKYTGSRVVCVWQGTWGSSYVILKTKSQRISVNLWIISFIFCLDVFFLKNYFYHEMVSCKYCFLHFILWCMCFCLSVCLSPGWRHCVVLSWVRLLTLTVGLSTQMATNEFYPGGTRNIPSLFMFLKLWVIEMVSFER